MVPHPTLPGDLGDFLGHWQVRRRIADAHAVGEGVFNGTARIAGDGGQAVYDEAGWLTLGGARLRAGRRYLWRAEPSAIAVAFADGRPFHRIDLRDARPADRHLCAADHYAVRYDFGRWPVWESQWQVDGPCKRYAMVTRYSPA